MLLPLLLVASTLAAQLAWQVDKDRESWSFEVRFDDSQGQGHTATYTLPAADVKADLDEPFRFKEQEAARRSATAVNAWAAGRKGPKVQATVKNGGVRITATGHRRKAIQRTLEEASGVQEQAFQSYLAENGFVEVDGAVLPDHARHVVEYADDLAPVVEALGGPGSDPRAFADLALAFAQSIPYEQRKRDRYRRPLSLLGANTGDCDGKSTLFLALMRQAWPQVPLTLFYVPDHAFVGLGLEPVSGDTTVRRDGATWVLAEPVGPALLPVGQVSRPSRKGLRWGRGQVRVVDPPSP